MKPNNSVIVEEWQVYLHSFFNFCFKNILNIRAAISILTSHLISCAHPENGDFKENKKIKPTFWNTYFL